MRARSITNEMKIAAAYALADATPDPSLDRVLPDPLDRAVAPRVASAVASVARLDRSSESIGFAEHRERKLL